MWKASRGLGGKSYLLALLGHCEANTLAADVTILGGSGEQALRVIEYLQKFSGDEDNTTRRTLYASGGRVTALMASSKSARGPHPQRMRLDEVDEMELAILDAAMGQPMEGRGIAKQTVMSSTHHYADATFTEVMRRADEKGWPVYEWCLDGESDIMTPRGRVRMKRLSVGDAIYAHKDGRLIKTEITDAWCSGVRPTIKIVTDAGTLRCTPDHRILTGEGWKEAGHISEGESVCAVREVETSLQRRRLSEMPQRQEVCGLWQGNHQRSDSLQCLPRESKRHEGEDAGGQVDLSVMQGTEAGRIASLSEMFPARTHGPQYPGSGNDGAGASADRTVGQQSKASEFWRSGGARVIFAVIFQFLRATVIRSLRGGFCVARLQTRRRSERQILAYEAGTDRARLSKASNSRSRRSTSVGVVDGRVPLVGFTVVRRVENSDAIPVYDLTVKEGSSFVANGIVVHNCYKETSAELDGWLSLAEIESKRGEVTASMWKAEYDLQEPSPEDRAILPDAVDRCFRKELGEYLGELGREVIIEEPVTGAEYATGADWAKKKDFTVIDTFRIDVRPMRRVAWVRLGRMPWPMMIAKFDARVAKYPGRSCHDATGLGDVVGDYQEANARGVVLTGQTRSDVFTKYIAAIEDHAVESAAIKYCEGEHRYCTNDDLSGSGHPPDSFVAGAMAYKAANERDRYSESDSQSWGTRSY